MSDTPETDAASQSWLRIRTNGETFIDENGIVLADKMEAMERQRNDALQLARELRDALFDARKRLNSLLNSPGGAMAIHDSMLVAKCERASAKANQLLCN